MAVGSSSRTSRLLGTLSAENRRQREPFDWHPSRLEVLQRKVGVERIAGFERSCARGQLAAARGDFETAGHELEATLREFENLYPANGHLFSHLLQLGLAMQLTETVAVLLDDRFNKADFFRVTHGPAVGDPVVNRVEIRASGHCVLYAHPRMVGLQEAEYFISHWQSSARLWASYCGQDDWVAGSVIVNSGEHGCVAGLAYCANAPEYILIPDGYFLGSQGYAEVRAKYDAARPAWNRRHAQAFWRGATSGIRTGKKDWQSLPRIRLCRLAQENAAELDAGLSSIVQMSEQDRHAVEAAGLMKGAAAPEQFLNYKYQIDIDGNSNAWPGLFQKLLTGSAVLKVASPHGFRQWYYERLKPWVNYVPVEPDMSDLVSKIQWLQQHDDRAQAIGESGLALARSMTYRSELRSAHRTIRATFLAKSRDPEVAWRVDDADFDASCLTQGWERAAGGKAWGVGAQSTITLPRPALTVDYDVCLGLEPHIFIPYVTVQRVAIAANGVLVAEHALSERQNVTFHVSGELIARQKDLTITILHPDGFAPCIYEPVADDRIISVAITALSLRAGSPG